MTKDGRRRSTAVISLSPSLSLCVHGCSEERRVNHKTHTHVHVYKNVDLQQWDTWDMRDDSHWVFARTVYYHPLLNVILHYIKFRLARSIYFLPVWPNSAHTYGERENKVWQSSCCCCWPVVEGKERKRIESESHIYRLQSGFISLVLYMRIAQQQ